MVCQIEFPASWQTLTGAKLDFFLSNTKSRDKYLPVSLVGVKNLLQYDSASDRKK